MAKITLNEVYNAITKLGEEIAKTNKRVLALEKASMKASTPAPAGKGKSTKTSKKSGKAPKGKGKEQPKVAVKLADFEPKGKVAKGKYTNWASYKAQRKAYCVAVATNGKFTDSVKAYAKGIRIDYEENSVYYQAKAKYEQTYAYVRKADR